MGQLIASVPDKDDPIFITLEEAERFNAAILSLKQWHPKIHTVLMARYFYGVTDDKTLGKRMGASAQSIRVWRKQGHMFVEGDLCRKYAAYPKGIQQSSVCIVWRYTLYFSDDYRIPAQGT